MALMFGDNHSTTFNTNLEKMIELILNTEAPRPMKVDEIVFNLSKGYNLNFTDIEVIRAIEGNRGKERITCVNPNAKIQGEKAFILNEKAIESIERKVNTISITEICNLFLKENPEANYNIEEMESLISKYFYRCFNSNATTIMQLLKQQYQDGILLTADNEDGKFTDDEKRVLNTFIFWENTEKDRFVYQMVSCCFDYCTMTARKDSSVYETVFKNKIFVLDTNIIFRIIGINRNNRKVIIDAFLNKCKEVGIKLVITNETRAEIRNTINYNVDKISELISNSAPINTRFVKDCPDVFVNEDFYQYYYEWCQNHGNKTGNIAGFREDLLKIADRVCNRFEGVTFTTYSIMSKEKYELYTKNLLEYKSKYKKYVREATVNTDVNNFMYVVGMNERKHAEDFFSLSYFHISADHIFCNWVKEIRPGSIPEVVLPSVWYSIILHYSGRAADNDDFSAFTRFLYFSISTSDGFKDEKKAVLLKKVARLNEPVDVKEEILIDVGNKLSGDYKDADDETIDELIAEANNTITEQRVAEAVLKEKQLSQLNIDRQKEEGLLELNKLTTKHESEIKELKSNMHKFEEDSNKKLEQGLIEKEKAVLEAKVNERKKLIDIQANERGKIWYKSYCICSFLFIVALLSITVYGIYYAYTTKLNVNNINTIIFLSGIIIAILGFVGNSIIYKNWFCELKVDKIIEREKKKLEKKYSETD